MSVLNVRDYGARGDGRTDDTDAIQSAIDDASDGDTVYIPEPDEYYKVSKGRAQPIITISGDNANPLTVKGDGENTVIRVADDSDGNWGIVRITDPEGFDCEVRDLVFDGNRRNQDSGTGFRFRDTSASDTGDVLVEDVVVRNCPDNGWSVQYGGVTLNRTTSHSNGGHGGGVATNRSGQHDPPMEVTNSHFYNNSIDYSGRYEWDFSGGKGIMTDCVLEDNKGNGMTKTSVNAIEFSYQRVRMQNDNGSLVYQNTGGSGASVSFEDIVCEGLGGYIRLSSGNDYRFDGDFILRNCGSNASRNIYGTDGASLSSGSGSALHITDTDASREIIRWDSSGSGSLASLQKSGNGGSSSVTNNGNLSITDEGSDSRTDIDVVPNAADVGAWSTGSSDSDEEEQEEEDETEDDDTTQVDSEFTEWTPRWASNTGDWGVVAGSEFAGGHALQFETDGSGRTRQAISWDAVGEPSDVEVLDRFRVPAFHEDEERGYHARTHLRSSTENGNEVGYWTELEAAADGFRLAKYRSDGGLTTMERFGTPVENEFMYRRFRAEGDEVKVKVWPANGSEPSGWDVEVTDADHDEGWVGLGSFDAEAVETDVLSVAVGGETARITPDGPRPTIAWVSPSDGATVDGDVDVTLDVDGVDATDVSVEYRADGGTWSDASYDGSGTFSGSVDTTAFEDGELSLEARLTDGDGDTVGATVDVVVDNGPSVETLAASDVTDEEATLRGELTNLGGSEEVTVWFEWRAVGEESWTVAGERTLAEAELFDRRISGLDPDAEYEFRAAVDDDGDTVTGTTRPFATLGAPEESSAPSIDAFDITDRSDDTWSRFEVEWAVSDEERELDTVITTLEYQGVTVAAESTSVYGQESNHTHVIRVRGDVDRVRLWVNDTSNESDDAAVEV